MVANGRASLALSRGVFESVLNGGGPGASARINDRRGNSDKAGDNGILQSFHTALVLEEIHNRFHFCLLSLLKGLGSAPGLPHWPGLKNRTRTAGVISGNLSDRFLPITATFRVRVA